jgi:hypothetical protein
VRGAPSNGRPYRVQRQRRAAWVHKPAARRPMFPKWKRRAAFQGVPFRELVC